MNHSVFRNLRLRFPLLGVVALAAVLLALSIQAGPVFAQEGDPGNAFCLSCHAQPGQTLTLSSGDTLSVNIDPALFGASVHGQNGISCVACHPTITAFPHPEYSATNAREFTLSYQKTCQKCHVDQYQADGVHQKALASGNTNAPVCSDCHNPHTQKALTDPTTGRPARLERGAIVQTCARCHNALFQEYAASVHGKAAIVDNNPDVPLCISCHGVHQIENPTTVAFRLASPRMCGNCHTDAAIMGKYGISTEVYNTYVADFHGTTVTLFRSTSPDRLTNKPVCYDCHGVHGIMKVDDSAKGLSVKENMLATCKKCHPDANENFPSSWLSHYIPSPTRYPLVYYVNLFYKILIPTVLGGMGLIVATDIGRKIADRVKHNRKPAEPAHSDGPTSSEEKKED